MSETTQNSQSEEIKEYPIDLIEPIQQVVDDSNKSVTSFEQWIEKSNKTEIIILPSGAVVELRRLNILEEAALGHISFELVNDAIAVSEKMSGASKEYKIVDKNLTNMMTLVNKVTVLATVKPEVSVENVGKIPIDDRMEIFNYVMRVPESRTLQPFRK